MTEALAEKAQVVEKHSQALTHKFSLEKKLREALARNALLERTHLDMVAQKDEADRSLSDCLRDNAELKKRLDARNSRERDTQEALSQLLRSLGGKEVAEYSERSGTQGTDTAQSLQCQPRTIQLADAYAAKMDSAASTGFPANGDSATASRSKRKRRNSSISEDELATGDLSRALHPSIPKRAKTFSRDSGLAEEDIELSKVTDRVHFYRQVDRTRRPYSDLSANVLSALEPYLRYFTRPDFFEKFGVSGRHILCERTRTVNKKQAEHKPGVLETCKYCLERSLPCILVEKGSPPTLVPLPEDLRLGKDETDPAYWIPGYSTTESSGPL